MSDAQKAKRLVEAEKQLAAFTENAFELNGEPYITHSATARILSLLHGITDAGGEHRLKRARAAGRLRMFAPHPRAVFYPSADVLKLIRGEEA